MVGATLTGACSDGGPEANPLVGTWNLTSVTVDGVPENPDDLIEIPVRFTFSDDGTGSADFETLGQPDGTDALTWSTNGGTLTLQFQGEVPEDITFTLNGDTLTLSGVDPDSGEVWVLVLTRQ
jgi:hypothetical protein